MDPHLPMQVTEDVPNNLSFYFQFFFSFFTVTPPITKHKSHSV